MTDSRENDAVRSILGFFKSFRQWEETLGKYKNVSQESDLAGDDRATPHFPISQFAYAQLVIAFGCLQSLEDMIVDENDAHFHVAAGPYGPYALVRNAMDTAACALWLLQPVNSKLRIKRRITAQMGDIHNAMEFRKEVSAPAQRWAADYTTRMQEVADGAGIGQVVVRKLKMPSMTSILRSIEHLHQQPVISWLGAWQLCSGHAHGKQWATLTSNELEELQRTANDLGAEFRITISYGSLAVVLEATASLLQAACERYSELAKPSAPKVPVHL